MTSATVPYTLLAPSSTNLQLFCCRRPLPLLGTFAMPYFTDPWCSNCWHWFPWPSLEPLTMQSSHQLTRLHGHGQSMQSPGAFLAIFVVYHTVLGCLWFVDMVMIATWHGYVVSDKIVQNLNAKHDNICIFLLKHVYLLILGCYSYMTYLILGKCFINVKVGYKSFHSYIILRWRTVCTFVSVRHWWCRVWCVLNTLIFCWGILHIIVGCCLWPSRNHQHPHELPHSCLINTNFLGPKSHVD